MTNRLTPKAKALRKNMTEAERKLWNKLRQKQLGVKFRRQQPIGRYIVDFVSFEKRLIIEIDGVSTWRISRDAIRGKWLTKNGFKVLRFWNREVLENAEGVLKVIMREVVTLPSIPSH